MSAQPDFFDKYSCFFSELKSLFARMDRKYDRVAGEYGFVCDGCSDNCCLTRFYHHTLLEFLYLRNGFSGMNASAQKDIRIRAQSVNKNVDFAEERGESPRVMCPLNDNGRCVLYLYRPMICRLHGIPHEFYHPIRKKIPGPGCHEFERQFGDKPYVAFDRTPFYREMAELEGRLRENTGIRTKFRKTVAQMLVLDLEEII